MFVCIAQFILAETVLHIFQWRHQLLVQFAVRFHKATLFWLPHQCFDSGGSKVTCTCRGPVDSYNLWSCCLLFPVVWFNQTLHHMSHWRNVCVRTEIKCGSIACFFVFLSRVLGKEQSESYEFSLLLIVDWDFALTWEVLMYWKCIGEPFNLHVLLLIKYWMLRLDTLLY